MPTVEEQIAELQYFQTLMLEALDTAGLLTSQPALVQELERARQQGGSNEEPQ